MGDSTSIAVVGVGAIGGAMAAALGDAGHKPLLCARTPFPHLSRSLNGETREYAHPVCTDSGGLSPVDWVLLCTKAHQIEGAAHWLHRLIGPETRVAVMQNGVDHVDRVSIYVPAERVVPCIIFLPSRLESPGIVEQGRAGTVQVPDSQAGRALADLFADQSAVEVEPSADFVSAVWSKLVLNAVGGAICALAIKPLSAVAAPEVAELATGLMEEIMCVGRAEGARFPDDFAEKTFETFRGAIGSHWTSMAADRRDGRLMEWQARNAVVGQIGRRHDIPTPLNDALTALLAVTDAA
jgi:2-dehydropantoate 2-reductase